MSPLDMQIVQQLLTFNWPFSAIQKEKCPLYSAGKDIVLEMYLRYTTQQVFAKENMTVPGISP